MKCEKNQYGQETWTYEPGEMAEGNRFQMERDRQRQDFRLAVIARCVVGFLVAFGLGMGTIIAYKAMDLFHH